MAIDGTRLAPRADDDLRATRPGGRRAVAGRSPRHSTPFAALPAVDLLAAAVTEADQA
ncbi:hypothetical protein [Plantactinospora endophytica]|nr:hypothetical protein [Plantactinospora endophytica]